MEQCTFKNIDYIVKKPQILYDKNPCIIFLHGAGTRGKDINKVAQNPFLMS